MFFSLFTNFFFIFLNFSSGFPLWTQKGRKHCMVVSTRTRFTETGIGTDVTNYPTTRDERNVERDDRSLGVLRNVRRIKGPLKTHGICSTSRVSTSRMVSVLESLGPVDTQSSGTGTRRSDDRLESREQEVEPLSRHTVPWSHPYHNSRQQTTLQGLLVMRRMDGGQLSCYNMKVQKPSRQMSRPRLSVECI